MTTLKAFLWTLIVAFLGALIMSFFVVPPRAHEFYDTACCNERDCRPAFDGEITRSPVGWVVKPLGSKAAVVVPYGQERPSPDGRYHLCTWKDGTLITAENRPCIYVPPMGF